ncbi:MULTISPECIES: ABC transporter substrate-binding protein [unclassified Nesterenkonia]|uniref:ABC transporter substrate-binding protein n=2 Tax=Nesterenkonia TaxID=57494 RepID=UPI000A50C94D|nr:MULTISPECIES: sugar ABC transporter substrate-binding protein [unclassified Nesterenkonia]MDS2171301.1 sugar ABC transporter substrate-binding protein [Nesterenkonia sp. CL21]
MALTGRSALRRRTLRRMTTLPLAVLAVGSLAACGSSPAEEVDTENLSGSITYWASNQGESVTQDEEVLSETIERFTDETGVEVELEVIPWNDLQNRILTAVSSGDAPDVLNIGNTWATSLQATGAFLEWEGEALEAIGGEERFIPSSWATGGAEGQAPTSVPLYALSYSLYYNTEIFEENGIDGPPATWEEFVEVAQELTQDTNDDGSIDQWGFTMAGASISNNSHAAFIRGLQHGGELYDDDGEPDFTNDAVVAGVNEWIQLMGADGVVSPSDAELVNGAESVEQVASGQAAMVFDQAPGNVFDNRGFEDYQAAPMPMLDADATGLEATQSHVAGINMSVFENSDNIDAAVAFVAHMTSDEEQTYLNQEFTGLPVVNDLYEDEAFQSDEIQLKQQILQDHAQPMPLYPSESQMETVVGTAMRDLLADVAQGREVTEDDVRDALTTAESQM